LSLLKFNKASEKFRQRGMQWKNSLV